MNDRINHQQGRGRHQLIFEDAWDRTMADSDRMKLKSLFEACPEVGEGEVSFLPYRVAYNHVGDLLATVLIQNGNMEALPMRDMVLQFEDAKGYVVEHSFSYPRIVVEGNSSMPWTFIFPRDVLSSNEVELSRWQVRIRD